jgi:hypothetical protein
VKLPWSVGDRLRPDDWESVRMRLMFDCCKWDIQSEDHSVVADFPLILEQEEWSSLAGYAEKLAREVLTAERELLCRPDLHKMLGLPEGICRVLRKCAPERIATCEARAMRFDFRNNIVPHEDVQGAMYRNLHGRGRIDTRVDEVAWLDRKG